MKPKITLKNIKSFIDANRNMFLTEFGLKSESFKEQISYRMLQCPDCLEQSKCKYCGCKVPDKMYATKSCNNGIRFPDIMDDEQWKQFKIDNKIE